MSYDVYTAEYAGKPNHVAIYIEINPDLMRCKSLIGDDFTM